MDKPVVRDGALFVLRLVAGLIFILHGCQIFLATGIDATAAHYAALGVPQPGLMAYAVAIVQIIAGALLIVGLLTTFVAGMMALLLCGTFYFVHGSVTDIEYPALLATSMLMIVVFGSGRASLDEVLAQ